VNITSSRCRAGIAEVVAYRYRFYPAPGKAAELSHTFGCVRLVRSKALEVPPAGTRALPLCYTGPLAAGLIVPFSISVLISASSACSEAGTLLAKSW
jgi:hypothetical protein